MGTKSNYEEAERYRRKGLSVSESCDRADISLSSYYYNRRRRKQIVGSASGPRVEFSEHVVASRDLVGRAAERTGDRPFVRVSTCTGIEIDFFERIGVDELASFTHAMGRSE